MTTEPPSSQLDPPDDFIDPPHPNGRRVQLGRIGHRLATFTIVAAEGEIDA